MRNLITAQEVIDLAFAENSNMMAESISDTAIRIAEIKYIRPAFGVMYPLLADKYADYTNDYVKPALAYFVKCEIVSSIAIDMSNSGVAVANPQYQSAASDKQRQRLYDSEMSKAKTLLDFALEYIVENKELFPDFNGEAPKKHHRLGGLLLGDRTSRNQSASITGETFNNELKQLSKEVSSKVDKVDGKGLSANDFTDEYKKKVDEFSGGGDEAIIPITHASLLVLRNAGELTKGAFYRITDYECTTVQAETRSANHPFDIIVQALDERTLSENAHAVAREGDDYFANCNLGAWQLKYTIDNDTTRHSWAKAEVLEQPQKWACEFGVLDSSFDNSPSSNYTSANIDGRTWYLYRPLEPTTHIEEYSFYRQELKEAITDVNDLIFIGDVAPEWVKDEEYGDEGYWGFWPEEIRVITKGGTLVRTFYNNGGNEYYDEDSGDTIYFDADCIYDDELGAYIYSTPDGAESWWENAYGGSFSEVGYIPYSGDTHNLSYAFASPLSKGTTLVYNVSDGKYIYSTANEDEPWSSVIDTVRYTAYVPYEEDGKGVIYEMVDEHNNHCPYDFKNMQFLHEEAWYYTFSFNGNDLSLTDYCVDNYIHTNRKAKFDDGTTPVPNSIPMVIFDAKPNSSGKTLGFAHNALEVPITKGYISARRIENFVWKSKLSSEAVKTLYINTINICSGNTIYGCASTFTVGSSSAPTTTFYDNEIHLSTFQTNAFKCDAATFVNNKLDLAESSAGFAITAGSITSCNITNTYYEANLPSDKIQFGANVILRDCVIKMYQALTINYTNTTSTTSPLRFLNIDARGWSASTISIPSTFPTNSPYELKVAKDSQGVVKMWCEADLAN